MTVLFHDAVGLLEGLTKDACANGDMCDCIFAGDTLLIGTDDACLNEYLKAVTEARRRYGMDLQRDKFQVLAVQGSGDIRAPDDTILKHVDWRQYLGAHLSSDADVGPELGRKIGEAKRTFSSF
eukprot:9042230-Pyramimonas_sp.AAC.1